MNGPDDGEDLFDDLTEFDELGSDSDLDFNREQVRDWFLEEQSTGLTFDDLLDELDSGTV